MEIWRNLKKVGGRLSAIFALVILSAYAGEPVHGQEGSASFPSVEASTVVIANPYDVEISFLLRAGDADPGTVFSIAAGSTQEYECDCSVEDFIIEVNTDGRVKTYSLAVTQRFAFFWNEEEGLWDVSNISQ